MGEPQEERAYSCLPASGEYEGSLPHCDADGGGHATRKGQKAPLSTFVLLNVSPSSIMCV